MIDHAYRINRTFRAEIPLLIMFVLGCAFSVAVSEQMPWTIVTAPLIGSYTLSMPLASFVPGIFLGMLIHRMYNVLYIVDEQGLEAQHGILSLRKTTSRVRYEDIRAADVKQTLFGRMLNFGSVEIGTAATDRMEIDFDDVSAPYDIRDFISSELHKRERNPSDKGLAVQPRAMGTE